MRPLYPKQKIILQKEIGRLYFEIEKPQNRQNNNNNNNNNISATNKVNLILCARDDSEDKNDIGIISLKGS